MSEIEILGLPELEGLTLIVNQQGLRSFVKKLRQDWYPPEKPEIFELAGELELWLRTQDKNTRTFFAFSDDENDPAKKDDWGSFYLFRCIAVRSDDGKIYVFKNLIANYLH